MKKEDILDKVKKENKQKDYVLIETENKAVKTAALSMLILSCIYFCLEIILDGKTNHGMYSLIAIYCAMFYGYKGIKTKNKFEILCMMLWGLVSVLLIIYHIKDVIAGAI